MSNSVGVPRQSRVGQPTLADLLADELADRISHGVGATITWLNHFSAKAAMEAGVPLDEFDFLGVDGILLCRLLGVDSPRLRTSADLVLPKLLERAAPLRVALVGARPETLRLVAAKIRAEYGHSVVLTRDGYRDRPEVSVLRRELHEARAQLVIVGLGTPLQDFYALGLKRQGMVVATCGGWLDQFSGDSYYPAWAYPLRLNWLVRLAREPRRLWRRYSLDAVRAVRGRGQLTAYVMGQGGRAFAAAVSSAPVPPTAPPVSAA